MVQPQQLSSKFEGVCWYVFNGIFLKNMSLKTAKKKTEPNRGTKIIGFFDPLAIDITSTGPGVDGKAQVP